MERQRKPAVKTAQKAAALNKGALLTGALSDLLAVFVCLAGAGAAFYFFWMDLNKSLTKINEAPIANVYIKKNTAQRRFGDRVVWDVLQKDSPVYSGDVIHTADFSLATIRFLNPDGTEDSSFDLAENSLIQVFANRIELANGKIDIKTSSSGTKLKLVSAGTIVEIGANSTVSANSASAGGGNIQILEGEATVTTNEGVQQAQAGEALSVTADGSRTTTPQVVPLSPKPNQSVLIPSGGGKTTIHFRWRTSNFLPEDFVRFEISSDQRFGQMLQSVDVKNAAEQSVSLEAGTYFWRVYHAGHTNGEGALPPLSNKLNILAAAEPKPLQPVDGSTIRYRAEIPAVRLQWTSGMTGAADAGIPENYFVEVSRSPSMENPRVRQDVQDQNFYVAQNLDSGMWYWRVRPHYEGALEAAVAQPSQIASFSLEQSTAALSSPQLTSPADGAELNIESGITLSWRADTSAASYTVQVARGSEFTSTALNQRINTNFINLSQSMQNPQDGVYYWRVASQDSQDMTSAFSPVRSFVLSTAAPPVELLYPRDGWVTGATALGAAHFTWKLASEGAARFQVSARPDFQQLAVDFAAPDSDAQVPALEAGAYLWRVVWAGMDGDLPRTYTTPARRFTVNESGRVTLEYPVNGSELDALAALRSPPQLRWTSAEPVMRSRIVLSTNADPLSDEAPLLDVQNPGRNVQTPPLRAGIYYWIVEAEAQSGVNISSTRPSSFRVGVMPLLPPPVLAEPPQGWTLDAAYLRSSRTVSFSWTGAAGANAYILSIYRESDRARAAPVYRSQPVRQTSLSFSALDQLDTGNFVWSVEPVFVGQSAAVEQRGETRESRFKVELTLPRSDSLPDEQTFGF